MTRLTRGLFILEASVLILIQAAGIAAAAAPLNDNFSTPTRISALPYNDSGTNREATTEAGEPSPCGGIGKTIWYAFQFTSEVNVTANTFDGPGIGAIDTVLAAYEDTGGGLASLINVACNDDSSDGGNGVESKINWIATANKTYFIQLGSFEGGSNDAGTTALFSFEVVAETAPHALSINDVTVTEGNAGTTDAVFTVTKTGSADVITTVDFATANNTATAGSDYTATNGTLTFAPGETTKSVPVTILDDSVDEANETFVVNLSNATNATIADNQGVGTITDNDVNDDPAPTLSINDVTVGKGDGTATFTVTLSGSTAQTVTVDFATANGTATAGSDYTATSGTLTFTPGETTKSVPVTILDDSVDEANETFVVNLSNATNATIADGQGQGTIIDNDPAPTLSINDVTVGEGDGTATFTVTLSGSTAQTVTVDFATANGTATAGSDYTATSGTLTFTPGETTKSVPVTILDDSVDEANETFVVNLSNATNATIADGQGQGTIIDNDPATGKRFVPLAPVRVLDTRTGSVTGTCAPTPCSAIAPGGQIEVQITGVGSVPSANVDGVIVNATVVGPGSQGFLTIFPTGQSLPVVSNLNFVPGDIRANLASLKVGDDGRVIAYNGSSTNLHVVFDVAGYYTDGTVPVIGGSFQALTPARLLDTRDGTGQPSAGAIPAGGTITLTVTNVGGVPASGVGAAVLNLTVDQPTATGFLTVYPQGTAQPLASNLNFVPGQTIPNLAAVKLSTQGKVAIFNGSSGPAHVIADVSGIYSTATATFDGGGHEALSPVRILDTRSGPGTPIPAGDEITVLVAGVGGVPPADVQAVVLNVTVDQPQAAGFLTVYPNGVAKPLASNLNFTPGRPVPNLVMVKVGTGGLVKVFNGSPGTVHVIFDVNGWFAPVLTL